MKKIWRTKMINKEIKTRLLFLEEQALNKKKKIEKELIQLESICKEILSLNEKLNKSE